MNKGQQVYKIIKDNRKRANKIILYKTLDEALANKIGNDIFDCCEGLSLMDRLSLISANMVRILAVGIDGGVWTKEGAIKIVNSFNDNIALLLDEGFKGKND